jgi:hypothetical protein
MSAPAKIKMPFDEDDNKQNMDKERIFTVQIGVEKIMLTKLEAIDLINALTGQLYAYELGRY